MKCNVYIQRLQMIFLFCHVLRF